MRCAGGSPERHEAREDAVRLMDVAVAEIRVDVPPGRIEVDRAQAEPLLHRPRTRRQTLTWRAAPTRSPAGSGRSSHARCTVSHTRESGSAAGS